MVEHPSDDFRLSWEESPAIAGRGNTGEDAGTRTVGCAPGGGDPTDPASIATLRQKFVAEAVEAAAAVSAIEEDLAAIESARDGLIARELPPVRSASSLKASARTADPVPVVLGGVLGVLLIAICTTAAVFMKVAR